MLQYMLNKLIYDFWYITPAATAIVSNASVPITSKVLECTVTAGKHLITGIYTLTSQPSNNNECINKINKQLKEMDLIAQFDIISAISSDIPENSNSSAVNMAINHVHEHVIKIKRELEQIHRTIEVYNKRWFTFGILGNNEIPDMQLQIKEIILYKKQLDNRLDILLKVLVAYGGLKGKHSILEDKIVDL